MNRLILTGLVLSAVAVFALAEDKPKPEPEAKPDPILKPVTRIEAKALDETSGLERLHDHWWAHNDSGGAAIVYRSKTLDFKDPVAMKVKGASAVDWEEITTWGDDLVVCDFGDNARERDDLKLYRCRWNRETDELERTATWPIEYPDGRHDAEAAFVSGDVLYVISKRRDEDFTGLYAFRDLKDGEQNVGTLVTKLDIDAHQMVTAADVHAASKTVAVLTYTHIFRFKLGALTEPSKPTESVKPDAATLITARQCEAMCADGDDLVFANEQRDVYRVEDYFGNVVPETLLPAPVTVKLPTIKEAPEVSTTGEAWTESASTLPMRDFADDEHLRWARTDTHLLVAGKVKYAGAFSATRARGVRLGSSVVMMFSDSKRHYIDKGDLHIVFGRDENEMGAWSIDLSEDSPTMKRLDDVKIQGSVDKGVFTFDARVPIESLPSKAASGTRVNVWCRNLHADNQPLLVEGEVYSIFRPYTWATIK